MPAGLLEWNRICLTATLLKQSNPPPSPPFFHDPTETVFGNLEIGSPLGVDVSKLEQLFSTADGSSSSSLSLAAAGTGAGAQTGDGAGAALRRTESGRSQRVSILDAQRAQRIEIMLTSFGAQTPEDICKAIADLDDAIFSPETVRAAKGKRGGGGGDCALLLVLLMMSMMLSMMLSGWFEIGGEGVGRVRH